jgi:hypothetical protein
MSKKDKGLLGVNFFLLNDTLQTAIVVGGLLITILSVEIVGHYTGFFKLLLNLYNSISN